MMNPIDSSFINNKPPLHENTTPLPAPNTQKDSETAPPLSANDRTTVTTLASQLSDAAQRAKSTYGHNTKQQLRDLDITTSDLLAGTTYNNDKSNHDAEIPNTQDPTLLERARQATNYANGSGNNPFSGMPRDQLELIIYDDSGNFTINERRAALYEESNQEYSWRKSVVEGYFVNRDKPGRAAAFYQTVLDHHRALPLVAQAAAPDGYDAKLVEWIKLELNVTNPTSEEGRTPNKNLTPEIAQKILARDSNLFATPDAP